MIKILLPVFLVFSACNPIDDARQDCREVAEQALDECIAFYEDVAIPEITEQLNGAFATIRQWFEEQIVLLKAQLEQALIDAKIQVLMDLGCVKDPANDFCWTCTDTVICN